MSIQCDVAGVGQVLEHLLNPDNTIRKQAEAILNQFLKKEYRAALWPVLLQLLRTSENPQVRVISPLPNAPVSPYRLAFYAFLFELALASSS